MPFVLLHFGAVPHVPAPLRVPDQPECSPTRCHVTTNCGTRVLREGAFQRAEVATDFPMLLQTLPDASVIAVDIPIGLLATGWRQADLEAKRFLHPRTSSVFMTPPRPVVEAASYPDANRLCRELT